MPLREAVLAGEALGRHRASDQWPSSNCDRASAHRHTPNPRPGPGSALRWGCWSWQLASKLKRKAPCLPQEDPPTGQGKGAPKGLLPFCRKACTDRWQEWDEEVGCGYHPGYLSSDFLPSTAGLTSYLPYPFPSDPKQLTALYTFQSTLLSLCFCLFLCVFHLHHLHHSFPGCSLKEVTRESLPRRAAGFPSPWLLFRPSTLTLLLLVYSCSPFGIFTCSSSLGLCFLAVTQFFFYPLPLLPTHFITLLPSLVLSCLWGLLCYSGMQCLFLAAGCDHMPCYPSFQLCVLFPSASFFTHRPSPGMWKVKGLKADQEQLF